MSNNEHPVNAPLPEGAKVVFHRPEGVLRALEDLKNIDESHGTTLDGRIYRVLHTQALLSAAILETLIDIRDKQLIEAVTAKLEIK
jgi:hypothetical protein